MAKTKKTSGKTGRKKGFPKERILNTAEIEFADRGYKNTSIRSIASAARVNVALINYYFGSKAKLYYAIFLRRGTELAHNRSLLLDELESKSNGSIPLKSLIHGFLSPAISMKHQGPNAMAFLRLQARLQSEPKEITARLRKAVYNESTLRYVEAIKKALPGIDPTVIYWRMTMMIGAYLYLVSDANRLDHLSNGTCDAQDEHEVLRQLTAFLIGGFKQPMSD